VKKGFEDSLGAKPPRGNWSGVLRTKLSRDRKNALNEEERAWEKVNRTD